MNIPPHLLEEEVPPVDYPKSTFTWISLGAAGVTVLPLVFFVIDYIDRILNPHLFMEFLGKNADQDKVLNGTEDFLAYVLMLMLAVIMVGAIVGLGGAIRMVSDYNKEDAFMTIRYGVGAALGCQGILIICTFVIWVANALSLYNGDMEDADGVRIVATSELLGNMSANVFGNAGMISGVWLLLPPLFVVLFFAEKDLKRREIKHV